jgi:hypothetical protein
MYRSQARNERGVCNLGPPPHELGETDEYSMQRHTGISGILGVVARSWAAGSCQSLPAASVQPSICVSLDRKEQYSEKDLVRYRWSRPEALTLSSASISAAISGCDGCY